MDAKISQTKYKESTGGSPNKESRGGLREFGGVPEGDIKRLHEQITLTTLNCVTIFGFPREKRENKSCKKLI